jgi:ribose 5-phosphate isomerase A
MLNQNELKRAAGNDAIEMVYPGMVVGLGSGSTARHATLRLAEKLRQGKLHDIVAVPTSEETAQLARQEGIPLATLEERAVVDLTIDGADEVDDHLDVIKGLGGYLLREKIVAYATQRLVIVVDETKLSTRLGLKSPVPVEVIRFGWRNTEAALARTGARTALRLRDGTPYITDEGNYIVDCWYRGIQAPAELSSSLKAIPGTVEHGIFLGMVQTVVVASQKGIQHIDR